MTLDTRPCDFPSCNRKSLRAGNEANAVQYCVYDNISLEVEEWDVTDLKVTALSLSVSVSPESTRLGSSSCSSSEWTAFRSWGKRRHVPGQDRVIAARNILQCSSQRQLHSVLLSQISEHSCGCNCKHVFMLVASLSLSLQSVVLEHVPSLVDLHDLSVLPVVHGGLLVPRKDLGREDRGVEMMEHRPTTDGCLRLCMPIQALHRMGYETF